MSEIQTNQKIDKLAIDTMAQNAIKVAGILDYSGSYTELGGGELNDTFLLHCDAQDIIMRISRHPGRTALKREARALRLLEGVSGAPKLIFFDEESQQDEKIWILESYQSGQHVKRLSIEQFQTLGTLLAGVHKIQGNNQCPDPWSIAVNNCHRFGDESYLLAHPDTRLQKQFQILKDQSKLFATHPKVERLRHCDVTPSNTLVNGEDISLIDWELSGFGDPMTDFSTGYWSDMELNNGKWRQKISYDERQALYGGYTDAGGTIDEHKILFYEFLDKIGVAAYLYWRMYVSDWQVLDGMEKQYRTDYEKILRSLEATP